VLWVRSYYSCDLLTYRSRDRDTRYVLFSGWHLVSSYGILALRRSEHYGVPDRGSFREGHNWELYIGEEAGRVVIKNGALGFSFEYSDDFRAFYRYAVTVPHWSVAILFLIIPALACCRLFSRRRSVAKGRCVRCGYDLRATPDCCPECGTVPGNARQKA